MKDIQLGVLPRALEEHYAELSWSPVINKTWFASDSASDMGRYAAACAEALTDASQSWDPSLAAAERDNIPRLFCNWRNKGYLPFHYTEAELRVVAPGQARYLQTALRSICERIVTELATRCKDEAFLAECRDAPFPINKGKGAPFWAPGSNREAALALTALASKCRSFDELSDRCSRAAAKMPIVITVYPRIQAAKSEREVVIPDREGGPQYTSTLALLPKVRKVQAVSYLINLAYARLGKALLETVRGMNLGILPRIEQVMATCKGVPAECIFAEDISGYDDSVGVETWIDCSSSLTRRAADILHLAALIPSWQRSLIMSLEDEIPSLPIIIPPQKYGTAARMLRRLGAIPSGIRLTSLVGSVINNARIRANLAHAKIHAVKAIFTFGDDTLIVFNSAADRTRYERSLPAFQKASAFKTTVADDASFLMKRVPSGYGYLSRMVMSTLQKEDMREPRTLETAALGMAARRIILKGHPDAALYDRLASEGAFGPRYEAAYRMAEALDFDVGALGHLVQLQGAGGAHTLEEVEQLIDELDELGAEEAASLAALFKQTLTAAKPSITDLEILSEQYLEQGKPAYGKIKDALGV